MVLSIIPRSANPMFFHKQLNCRFLFAVENQHWCFDTWVNLHTHTSKEGRCSATVNFRFKNQSWRDFMKTILQKPFQEILGPTAKVFVQSSGLVINVLFIWNWNKKNSWKENDDDLHGRIFHRRTSLPLREPWAQPPRKMALATIVLCFAQISTVVEFGWVRIYGSH